MPGLELQESLHMAAPDAARHRDRMVALYERLGDAAGSSPTSCRPCHTMKPRCAKSPSRKGWKPAG